MVDIERLYGTEDTVLPVGPDPGELATVVYTSGTTGSPKGVCLSHRNLATVVAGIIEHVPVNADDSYLLMTPVHFVVGLQHLLVHQLAGATVHLAEGGFAFPRLVVDELMRTAATSMSGVPFHLAALIDRGGLLQADLPHLRRITVGGDVVPRQRLEQIRQAMPNLELHVAYGQTECSSRVTALAPDRLDRKNGSVGAPIPGVEVVILGETGESLPVGATGEVVVRGDSVMLGYWQRPEDTARVIDQQGRLHTGDQGWLDEDGDLFLVGRNDTLLKIAGERVCVGEIEAVLNSHPDVAETVVLGVADRLEAHVGVGTVPTDPEVLNESIANHILGRLPFRLCPRPVHLWASLPRTAAGKIDRVALHDRSQALPESGQNSLVPSPPNA